MIPVPIASIVMVPEWIVLIERHRGLVLPMLLLAGDHARQRHLLPLAAAWTSAATGSAV